MFQLSVLNAVSFQNITTDSFPCFQTLAPVTGTKFLVRFQITSAVFTLR